MQIQTLGEIFGVHFVPEEILFYQLKCRLENMLKPGLEKYTKSAKKNVLHLSAACSWMSQKVREWNKESNRGVVRHLWWEVGVH